MASVKTNKDQLEKFREAARELGADENEERFDEAMKRLVKKPPEPREKLKPEK